MIKIIKKGKDYSYRESLKKLRLTTLLERRMKSDRIETLKIINRISNCGWHSFKYFSFNWKFIVKADFKK